MIIAAGAGVPPPACHSHSTGQLLQQQTDTPQVCEGEVSQVLPSCCCQTLQPALLHIDLTPYSALCNKSVQTHFITHIYYLYLKSVNRNLLLIFAFLHYPCKNVHLSIVFYFFFTFNFLKVSIQGVPRECVSHCQLFTWDMLRDDIKPH